MRDYSEARSPLRTARIVQAFGVWLRGVGGGQLVEAATLLGGSRWQARAQAVVDDVAAGAHPASHLAELRALCRLLHLGHVDDAPEEATLFAAIHPDDPRADSARLCAEALDRGVAALCAVGGSSAPSFEEAA